MPLADRPRTALVLSGGGARGAYQVGVIRGLVEHGFLSAGPNAIDLFVGSSAGAINCTALAAHADAFEEGVARLEGVWRNIRPSDVYLTDVASLGLMSVRWAWDLSLGGATGHVRAKSLLDTKPLKRLLRENIPFERLEANVAAGHLSAITLISTHLRTSNGVVFLHGRPDVPSWTRRRWQIERTALRVEHVLASSAIPILFPSVEVDGDHYSDGSIRNTAPLSPAINMGAERIIAIGVSGPPPATPPAGPIAPPTIADIAGVVLDAVMLDAIEVDVEHSDRVNASVTRVSDGDGSVFRHVDVLWLRPSTQVRELAADLAHRIPAVVRYLLRGLGSPESVTELVSYLLFDTEFCVRLMELGRQDVAHERERIARFFANGAG